MYTALIIDTISIQSYIFGSNKLKENIGGSYIIEHLVYKEMIPRALQVAGIPYKGNTTEWTQSLVPTECQVAHGAEVEIGYIGGGNALLIFQTLDKAKQFIKEYSTLLLIHFPGLKTAFGLEEGFSFQEGDDYQEFLRKLNLNLAINRGSHPVQVVPLKSGIVKDCPWTNEAEETNQIKDAPRVSQMTASRVNLVKDANASLQNKFKEELDSQFTFTDDIGKFGQPDDKGYVAIVHADGNKMGKRFIECKSLTETRTLSAGVATYADEVMKKLVSYIVGLFGTGEVPLADWKLDPPKATPKFLPIRPLIIGGDDITFVCEGRLGVHLAEKLLEFMTNTPINGKTIAACAGVAIVHTKYPFYKAYQIAEELTSRAKKRSREVNDGESSWLEYLISTGGFSGSLSDVIASQYTVPSQKELKYGPYRVDGQAGSDEASLFALKAGMKALQKDWPRNKVKDLRDALRRDEAYQSYFLTELSARKLTLPHSGTNQSLWKTNRSPYHDMVELLDFYPQELLLS